MKKERTRTTLRLDNQVIGYLHYLLRDGVEETINELIESMVENYMEAYANIRNKNLDLVKSDSMHLYHLTRRTSDTVKENVKKEVAKYMVNSNKLQPQQSEQAISREAQADLDYNAGLLRERIESERQYMATFGEVRDGAEYMPNDNYNKGMELWLQADEPLAIEGYVFKPTPERRKLTESELKEIEQNRMLMNYEAYMYYKGIDNWNRDITFEEALAYNGFKDWYLGGRPHPDNAKSRTEKGRLPSWYDEVIEHRNKPSTPTQDKNSKLLEELGPEEYERLYG